MTEPENARAGEGRPKLLFVAGDDGFFVSHRMPIARAARDAGFAVAVAVACPVTTRGDAIRAEGMRVLPIPMKRGRISPLADLRTLAALWRIYRAERPDIVHAVAMKPVLYGGAAARLAGVPAVVGALTGLGYVFSSGDLRARLLRPLVRTALRWALNGRRTTCLTQNPDDAAFVAGLGIDRHRIVVIPGSGVDTARFAPSPEPDGPLRATMVSRLLWDKGVGEFVEAARVARTQSPDLRFTLIGAPDEGNPAAVPLAQLEDVARTKASSTGKAAAATSRRCGRSRTSRSCPPTTRRVFPRRCSKPRRADGRSLRRTCRAAAKSRAMARAGFWSHRAIRPRWQRRSCAWPTIPLCAPALAPTGVASSSANSPRIVSRTRHWSSGVGCWISPG